MRIIQTDQMPSLSSSESLWAYNGLDCCVTEEILEALLPQLTSTTRATYEFSKNLQGPILEMNTRGLLIDEPRRQEVLSSYRMDLVKLAGQLNSIIRDGIGWNFEITKNRTNPWPSDRQLQTLFFDIMKLPTIWKRNAAGDRVRTVDRAALETLEHYFYAEPLVRHLYALREIAKKISFLSTASDLDGRMRTSFNIAGTTTGRLASSLSEFGTGTNLQNVKNRLRSVFIADPGYKFCNIDLEQGDSRGVGAIHWNLFRDGRYLDACESGDLHTTVACSAFTELPWTGDRTGDRALANGHFYREFSYRDAAKRLGHGTNYQGQPEKMSKATHIPLHSVERFAVNYLSSFPAFKPWWDWVERQLRDVRYITTLLGRQRYFFGHWRDPATLREAIAYEPQNITADTIDRGLLAIWRANLVQLLLQVHDSLLFQFPEELEDEIVPWALSLVEQTVILKEGRKFVIPGEAKVGWNWSDTKGDPDALRKWTDQDRPRRRHRDPSKTLFSFGL